VKNRKQILHPVCRGCLAFWIYLPLFLSGGTRSWSNPSGGVVAAGTATISSAGSTTTINQATANAIINWQEFSIGSNEATKFFVPTSSSATLNRVLGGNPSAIYGTLSSNGQIILINPNGIVVGPGGRIDVASFLGSTLNVSDNEFRKGKNLHFLGSGSGMIDNEGTIHASSGDVYLIAGEVNNGGTLLAPHGTVGLAAGNDIWYQQAGDQHLYVRSTPLQAQRATGVTNGGTIRAATAELLAAGNNAYALAINNTGQIAATGFKKVNGQVYLTADTGIISNSGVIRATTQGQGGQIKVTSKSGTIINAGKLDASATVAQGVGGSITLKSTGGTVENAASGDLDAEGGEGGSGGQVEISGLDVQPLGAIDTLAPGGRTGMFMIDPATFTVASSGGDETGAQVSADLATTDVTLNADNAVTIDDGITWTSTNVLTLSTNTSGSAIAINAPISGVNGGLTLDTAAARDLITTGAAGSVNVANFILENGSWTQNSATLPSFSASHDFELQGVSTFLRVTGGNGTTSPYQITDVYGLQGLASPSNNLLTANAELVNNIDASGTGTWNTSAGFVPIGNTDAYYSATFNGQGFVINGLTINSPSSDIGLFGVASGVLENVGLNDVQITGNGYVGGLVGALGNDDGGTPGTGSISNAFSTGNVNGSIYVGGLAGLNHGTSITTSYTGGTVSGGSYVGGVVGSGLSALADCYSTSAVTASYGPVGGLEGENYYGGSITDCYSSGLVTGTDEVGGLLGRNLGGSVNNSFWDTDTSGITSPTGGIGSGTNSGATPATTADLESQSYILANAPVSPTWNFSTVWTTNGGTTIPQLIGVSPNAGPGGTGGGTGGSTSGNTGTTGNSNPSSPGTSVSGLDGSGSNNLPPQLTPPNQDTTPTLGLEAAFVPTVPAAQPQTFGFADSGDFDQSQALFNGLAFASGNNGPIAAGDAAQLNGGHMDNVSNPAASGALDTALSLEVHENLQEALVSVGELADSYDEDSTTSSVSGGSTEMVGDGDVVEIGDGNVKKIPLSSAPKPLRDALGSGVMQGLQPVGH
jgi:filamentous hemagglutinin family protein